jgi:hypothetical protein
MEASAAATNSAAELANEELDLWWGSYDGRKLVPWVILYAMLTTLLFGFAWYFKEWHGNVVRYWVQLATGILWSVQLVRWSYRLISTSYRFTTHRLLYYRSLIRPVRQDMQLKDVAKVTVEQGRLDRLMDVGAVRVQNSGAKPLVFEAVHHPRRIADEIERQVQRSRVMA